MCSDLQSFLILFGAYCVGAIPSGYWFARLRGISDIRTFGSGNSGATNVGRALGAPAFLFVFAADCAKAYGYLAILQALHWDIYMLMLAACALMMGNVCSLFMLGSGGKGVATFMGILVVLYPMIALCAFITWLFAFFSMRAVGMASVVAVFAVPWYAVGRVTWFEMSVLTGLALLIVWRHRENIRTYYRV